MRIPEFSGLTRFLRESFEEMNRRKTETLILDVRNNGGGDDDQGKLLFSYLIDKPFQYYSDLVVNRLSSDFAKYATGGRATFIGEESGGGYYGNTSGFMTILTLPHSKLRVVIPLVRYRVAVSGRREASHDVIPDREVRYTIEDVLAGRDKEMELALSLLGNQHSSAPFASPHSLRN